MKCDLHVHTIHSGMCTIPLLHHICRESYNDPDEVYATLKRRGMDLVTVTDHDSIGAAEPLRRHADFFLSEEVSCLTSSGMRLHMGVYGIEERDHVQLQRRAPDMPSLLAYLEERDLLFSVNHVFSSLTGRRCEADFEEFAARFPAVETLNGAMLEIANRSAAALAAQTGKIAVGGSDAHTMASLGRTYTEVSGARNASEYLAGLKLGRTRVAGESGDYLKLTRAVASIGCDLLRERRAARVLLPLLAAVPLITLVNLGLEYAFAQKWSRRVLWNRAAPRSDFAM
ncbi:MAG TPA: PHP-associated domain-containing protein [Bryobacteraceae bacterium]|jgi:predicted metal-dependent phosphoesterase TrpH|nr:PHP-associated domain-containing protein [Bryobacteraceae bacterium]